VPGGGR